MAAAKIAAFAVNIALPLLLVRRLSQEEFGLYKQAFLIVGTMTSALPLSFSMSALYFMPREPDRESEFAANVALVHLVLGAGAALTVLTCPALVAWMAGTSALGSFIGVLSLVIFLWVFSTFLETVMLAKRDYAQARLFVLVAPIVRSALLVGAVIGWGSLRAVLEAAALFGLLQSIAAFVYLQARFPSFPFAFRWETMAAQFSYALPLAAAGALWVIMTDLHAYWVSSHFGPAAFALYSVGCFELPLIPILAESLAGVVIPRWSELARGGLDRQVVAGTLVILRSLAFVHFAAYAFLIACGREVLAVLFTDAYASSWPIFAVNLTLLPFGALIFDPIVRAYPEYRYYLLRLRVLFIVLLVILLYFGARHFGMIGAVSAMVAATLGERLVLIARMARGLGLSDEDKETLREVAKIALAAAVAGVAAATLEVTLRARPPLLVLAACAPTFAAIYALTIARLKIVKPDDLERLSAVFTRLRG
jgi:O-antigen/teichoic acid export membrane protein